MQVTLEIKDDFFEKFIHLIDALPQGMVTFQKDRLAQELQRRIDAIESGAEQVTPYFEGMDEMIARVKNKYENR